MRHLQTHSLLNPGVMLPLESRLEREETVPTQQQKDITIQAAKYSGTLTGRPQKNLKKFASKCLTVVEDVLWFPPPSNRSYNKQRCEPTDTYRDCHKNGWSSWDARKPIFKSQRFPHTPSKEGAHGDHEYSLLLRCQRLSSYNDYSLSGYSPRVKSRRLFSPSGSN